MKDKHSNLPQESWYIQDTADIGADIAIKTEVAPEDIWIILHLILVLLLNVAVLALNYHH